MLSEILTDVNLWKILIAFFVWAPLFGVASVITASASFLAFLEWLDDITVKVDRR